MSIKFTADVTGAPGLRAKFRTLNSAITLALGKGIIEKYLLARTKGRFSPRGTTPTAQKTPDGASWARPQVSTIGRRVRAGYRGNANQALYQSGTLQRSIQVLRRKVGANSLQSTEGGYFVIGVNRSSPAYVYGRVHQVGNDTTPAREFLGIGQQDVTTITEFLRKTVQRGVNL